MSTRVMENVPGPSLLPTIAGIYKHGFLDFVGETWTRYGDIFQIKFGSNHMIFGMHPEFIHHVTVANRQNYDKLSTHDPLRDYLTGEGLITSIGDVWRQQRKLMSPFYTPKGVLRYAGIMLRDGEKLVKRWEQIAESGETVEIGEEMMLVTASVILNCMFSMETDEAVLDLKESVESMISFTMSNLSILKFPLWVPTAANRKYLGSREKVHAYIGQLIRTRREIPEAQWPDDLLTRLMQARDEETGEQMSEAILRDECITIFAAGYETTARTMSFAWYALASNPEVAAKLHAELDMVLGDRSPCIEDLPNLPYTLQVIKEVLRLYPPAPFYIREAIADDSIDGFHIPAGCGAMMSPYYTHRHPDFWDRPLAFDPQRWTPENEAKQHKYAYHPFAAGPRVCIGNSFSLLETQLLLAQLARCFNPVLVDGYVPEWEMQAVLGTANGFPMQIEFR